MIEEALKTYLCAQGSISSIVGDRVTPEIKPQKKEYPCITYSRDRTQRDKTFQGQSPLVKTEIQIDAWGDDYGEAKKLHRAIQSVLRNLSNVTMGTLVVDKAFLEDAEADVYEQAIEKYRSSQLYSFWYCET